MREQQTPEAPPIRDCTQANTAGVGQGKRSPNSHKDRTHTAGDWQKQINISARIDNPQQEQALEESYRKTFPHTHVNSQDFPDKLVTTILVASVCYLSVLSFLNARGVNVSAALVGFVEALIFTGCLSVQMKRLHLSTIALSFCVCAWIVFTWLIRQNPDVKSLRDLIIPVLFLSLGQYVADVGFADRCLKLIVGILVIVGLFEVVFTDTYANLFNTFSFYVHLGGISKSAAMFEGQMLTLNGYRPEGIGRTILPFLLGPHRASSVLMRSEEHTSEL